MKKTLLISFLCFALDQITKMVIVGNLDVGQSIGIIKNFFNITLVYNKGAAFSMFKNSGVFLIIISLLVVIFLLYYIIKSNLKKHEVIIYGIITGGILGNLYDRIIYGAVVDFLQVGSFPIFNLADVFIVCGIVLLVIFMIGDGKYENSRG